MWLVNSGHRARKDTNNDKTVDDCCTWVASRLFVLLGLHILQSVSLSRRSFIFFCIHKRLPISNMSPSPDPKKLDYAEPQEQSSQPGVSRLLKEVVRVLCPDASTMDESVIDALTEVTESYVHAVLAVARVRASKAGRDTLRAQDIGGAQAEIGGESGRDSKRKGTKG